MVIVAVTLLWDMMWILGLLLIQNTKYVIQHITTTLLHLCTATQKNKYTIKMSTHFMLEQLVLFKIQAYKGNWCADILQYSVKVSMIKVKK